MFSRLFNDSKLDMMESFLARIHQKRVFVVQANRVHWKLTKCEKFYVKSLYEALKLEDVVPFRRNVI